MLLRGIINSYGHNWTKEYMFDNLELRVGAGSELVVDLVTQGGSVVDEAPELFRNVHVDIRMNAPGVGGRVAQTKVVSPLLILFLLRHVLTEHFILSDSHSIEV